MKVERTLTFSLNPSREYGSFRDKVEELKTFILDNLGSCSCWVIMSPELIWLLLTVTPGFLTRINGSPGEYVMEPTQDRVTEDVHAGDGMYAILRPFWCDKMVILECGSANDVLGDVSGEEIWGTDDGT